MIQPGLKSCLCEMGCGSDITFVVCFVWKCTLFSSGIKLPVATHVNGMHHIVPNRHNMCDFETGNCSRATGPSHDNLRTPNVISGPARFKHQKFHKKTPKRGRKNEHSCGRGKKARNCGPTLLGPHPECPLSPFLLQNLCHNHQNYSYEQNYN